MKKILPVALIVAITALAFTSCKKSSTTTTCTCTYPGSSTGGDTTIKVTNPPAGSGYGSVSDYCTSENNAIKAAFPTGSCHL